MVAIAIKVSCHIETEAKSIRLSFESLASLTTSTYFAEVNEADAVKAEAGKLARKAEKITWRKLGAALDRAVSKTTRPSYWPSELAKQGVVATKNELPTRMSLHCQPQHFNPPTVTKR